MVHPKVAAGGAAAALATLIIFVASLFGVTITGEVGAALATIIAFIAGYFTPPSKTTAP